MGALEQTGNEYKDFFDFLMQKKPAACFHFEPIYEHYNKNMNIILQYFCTLGRLLFYGIGHLNKGNVKRIL
jgi:hypothetical protein